MTTSLKNKQLRRLEDNRHKVVSSSGMFPRHTQFITVVSVVGGSPGAIAIRSAIAIH
jgi:hypothetical protein